MTETIAFFLIPMDCKVSRITAADYRVCTAFYHSFSYGCRAFGKHSELSIAKSAVPDHGTCGMNRLSVLVDRFGPYIQYQVVAFDISELFNFKFFRTINVFGYRDIDR